MQHWKLTDKWALITGASTGIGKAVNKELLALGAKTIIVARSGDKLKAIASQFPGRCFPMVADLSNPGQIEQLSEKLQSMTDRLDILVNNAGRNLRKPTLEYSLQDLQEVMRLNAESVFLVSQKMFPLLKAAGDASVINVSSITSYNVVQTSTAAYHMSKGALDQLTRFLAVEWGRENIRVNAVHPWYISTPLGKEVLKDAKKRKRIEQATPLRRVGEPAEAARAVAFLAMPASSYITGAHLTLDGGFSKAGLSFED